MSTTVSPRANSQRDLAVNDLALRRLSSIHPSSTVSPFGGEDTSDMDNRGKELALRCWNEDEEFLAKDKIAEWLGGQ